MPVRGSGDRLPIFFIRLRYVLLYSVLHSTICPPQALLSSIAYLSTACRMSNQSLPTSKATVCFSLYSFWNIGLARYSLRNRHQHLVQNYIWFGHLPSAFQVAIPINSMTLTFNTANQPSHAQLKNRSATTTQLHKIDLNTKSQPQPPRWKSTWCISRNRQSRSSKRNPIYWKSQTRYWLE